MKFTLRDHPVIFDVGGFKGDWTREALDRYPNSTIYVFEPVTSFYEEIVERYKHLPNVKVFNFGLSSSTRHDDIYLLDDSSSLNKEVSDRREGVFLRNIVEFLFEHQIFFVDLIKINIEGEEYRLLEFLAKIPESTIFQNYLIQFHNFLADHPRQRNEIRQELSKRYECVVNYEFVFEGWSIKSFPKTLCVGDSHISIFSNKEGLLSSAQEFVFENFRCLSPGPYLAYTVSDNKSLVSLINKSKEENVIICFGEIDCRAQVHKRLGDKTYVEIISEIVTRYADFLSQIHKNITVFSITPDLKESVFPEYYNNNPDVFDCPRGSYLERRTYKEFFNKLVKEMCDAKDYRFVSIYNSLVDEDSTKIMYYLDDIHLNPSKVLYLIKYNLLS